MEHKIRHFKDFVTQVTSENKCAYRSWMYTCSVLYFLYIYINKKNCIADDIKLHKRPLKCTLRDTFITMFLNTFKYTLRSALYNNVKWLCSNNLLSLDYNKCSLLFILHLKLTHFNWNLKLKYILTYINACQKPYTIKIPYIINQTNKLVIKITNKDVLKFYLGVKNTLNVNYCIKIN